MTKLASPAILGFMRIAAYLLTILIFASVTLEARVDRRPPCYKDLERNFFDINITSTAFSLYSIQQGAWRPMIKELQSRSASQVPLMTWKEGQKMRPNPLDTRYYPSPAGEILGRVLYEVFHAVCVEYIVTSDGIIRKMFNYIEKEQAAKIRNCFGRDTFMPERVEENKS